jgi:pseudouridine-5'-phosphate glycosidase
MNDGRPVVALESTIISHGMPWPRNAETAFAVEDAVRRGGAVPATVAIIEGVARAGLERSQIERLAKAGSAAAKVSRRDMAFVMARKQDGATTVAATMIIAAWAGIRVFATGGIGGVHRGAAQTFDISADLHELAVSPVAVVCAGCKSILDIGLTLEYLETLGVPVAGYKCDAFPAFYTQDSGFAVDFRVDSVDELARVMKAKWDNGLSGGILVANPIPAEHSYPKEEIESLITRALNEAGDACIKGKEITPFLLGKIVELSGGKSLDANINLVLNNASIAAKLALAYTNLS